MHYFSFFWESGGVNRQTARFCDSCVCRLRNVHSSSHLLSFLWSCAHWLTAALLLEIKLFFIIKQYLSVKTEIFLIASAVSKCLFRSCMNVSQNQIYNQIYSFRGKKEASGLMSFGKFSRTLFYHDRKHLYVESSSILFQRLETTQNKSSSNEICTFDQRVLERTAFRKHRKEAGDSVSSGSNQFNSKVTTETGENGVTIPASCPPDFRRNVMKL